MDHLLKSPRLTDVTDTPEMAELLRVADAMISDYSCAAGDFALRMKPIWLCIADIDEYTQYSRKLYVNPLDTPYWMIKRPEGAKPSGRFFLLMGTIRLPARSAVGRESFASQFTA